jgi:lipooligosaccharide transport system permease protein
MTARARPALRVFQRNFLVYKRVWQRSMFFGFLQPFLFLTAMGIGLSQLIGPSSATALGGLDYVAFLGPGLMGAMAMQTATFESTYPIMNKIMWGRNYEAMLATPLRTRHLLLGELTWISFRVLTLAVVFLVVLVIFGIARSPLALLAIPVAVLTGFGFSSSIIAFTARQKRNDTGFTWLFRFVINPLFFFSGTFFPLASMPGPVQALAWATPLYHGVELVRGLVLDRLDLATAPWHLLYLLAFATLGFWLADWSLYRRLAV